MLPTVSAASSTENRSLSIAAAALLLFALNFALHYPGQMNPDSVVQYREAVSGRYSDWHPPIMAFTWSLLRHLSDGPQTILAFHLILHWLGFGLLADGLHRAGRRKAAWLMLAAGAFPLFIYYNGNLLKDVGAASAFLAGFALIFRHRIQGRRPPPITVGAALALIAYGALVRANAVFAFAPLLLYALVDPVRIGAVRLLLFTCLLSAAAIPASAFINHTVLRAAPAGAMQSLQLFDLAGIARYSGDLSVLPPTARLSPSELERCYTPYWWDSLSPWGHCKFVSQGLASSAAPLGRDVGKMWIDAIAAHPGAYAQHRLRVFNSMMYFFVPAKHCRLVASCGMPDPGTDLKQAASARDIRLDYLKKSPFVWPVSWMALGICMVALLGLSAAPEQRSAGRTLLVSGLGYSLAYAVVGVATDVRYYYWSIAAILTSVIVAFPLLSSRIRAMDRTVIACIASLILILGVGLFARLTDNQSLVF
jgi:hypothetical protein